MVAREVGGTGVRGGRVREEWGVVVRGEGREERGEGGGGKERMEECLEGDTREACTQSTTTPRKLHLITPPLALSPSPPPTSLITLMSIQLLLEVVMILKRVGAKER